MKKVPPLLVVLSAIAVLLLVVVFFAGQDNGADYGGPVLITDCVFRVGNDECVSLVLASTPEERVRGLSGRDSMPVNEGMLFDFQSLGTHCIWMKDMNFSLDLIWIDEDKRAVDMAKNVTPASFPETFCNDKNPARYVVEVNAGAADEAGLRIGSKLDF